MSQTGEYFRKWVRDHMARGLCRRCSRPSKEGATSCEGCLEKQRVIQRKRRYGRISNGLCVKCGKSKKGVTALCSSCKTIQKELHTNKCIDCSGIRDLIKDGKPLVRCSVCTEHHKKEREARQAKRREAGLCLYCGRENNTHRLLCLECSLKIKIRLVQREKKEQERRRKLKEEGVYAISRQRKYQIRHRELGLCESCSEEALEGKKKCSRHAEKRRKKTVRESKSP